MHQKTCRYIWPRIAHQSCWVKMPQLWENEITNRVFPIFILNYESAQRFEREWWVWLPLLVFESDMIAFWSVNTSKWFSNKWLRQSSLDQIMASSMKSFIIWSLRNRDANAISAQTSSSISCSRAAPKPLWLELHLTLALQFLSRFCWGLSAKTA